MLLNPQINANALTWTHDSNKARTETIDDGWQGFEPCVCGGAKGIRTPDLLIANETRYQLRHSPEYRKMVAPASGGVANRHCPTALGQWLSSSMSQSAGAARRGFGPSGRSAVGMMAALVTGADKSMVRTVRGTSGFET